MRVPTALVLTAVTAAAHGQVILGQIDTFQGGTNQGWAGGGNPVNIATGGPAGAGDRYLSVGSSGGTGQGSRLATHNDQQWSGNFQAAGVTHVAADLLNEGATTLEIRLVLFLFASPNARYTSVTPVVLAPGSGWRHATFALDSASLVRVDGTASYQATITDVSRIMFRHDAGTPSAGGSVVVGRIGIDNVQAVPEPMSMAGVAFGIACLARSRSRKRS